VKTRGEKKIKKQFQPAFNYSSSKYIFAVGGQRILEGMVIIPGEKTRNEKSIIGKATGL
jgi:hypothetical protein